MAVGCWGLARRRLSVRSWAGAALKVGCCTRCQGRLVGLQTALQLAQLLHKRWPRQAATAGGSKSRHVGRQRRQLLHRQLQDGCRQRKRRKGGRWVRQLGSGLAAPTPGTRRVGLGAALPLGWRSNGPRHGAALGPFAAPTTLPRRPPLCNKERKGSPSHLKRLKPGLRPPSGPLGNTSAQVSLQAQEA